MALDAEDAEFYAGVTEKKIYDNLKYTYEEKEGFVSATPRDSPLTVIEAFYWVLLRLLNLRTESSPIFNNYDRGESTYDRMAVDQRIAHLFFYYSAKSFEDILPSELQGVNYDFLHQLLADFKAHILEPEWSRYNDLPLDFCHEQAKRLLIKAIRKIMKDPARDAQLGTVTEELCSKWSTTTTANSDMTDQSAPKKAEAGQQAHAQKTSPKKGGSDNRPLKRKRNTRSGSKGEASPKKVEAGRRVPVPAQGKSSKKGRFYKKRLTIMNGDQTDNEERVPSSPRPDPKLTTQRANSWHSMAPPSVVSVVIYLLVQL